MTREEAEKKIKAKFLECVGILKEYDENSNYLTACYMVEEGETFVKAYNEAFKKDVKPLDVWECAEDAILIDFPRLYTLDEFEDVYDELATEYVDLARKVGGLELAVIFSEFKTKMKEALK